MYTQNLKLSSISLDDVSRLWKENDTIIFLADLDIYNILSSSTLSNSILNNTSNSTSNNISNNTLSKNTLSDMLSSNSLNNALITEYLSSAEKENLEKFQTLYFKKRFIVSRIILKHILCRILDKASVPEISTYKKGYGGVYIHNYEGIHICISYSENIISLAISKVRIGIDIEVNRPLKLKNNLRYCQNMSQYYERSYPERQQTDVEFLKTWTMKEAYCKYSGKSMLLNLNKEPDASDIYFSNYILDGEYIFSIAADQKQYAVNICRLEKIN